MDDDVGGGGGGGGGGGIEDILQDFDVTEDNISGQLAHRDCLL